jgi:iron(III) transport system substrate-binding protein
MSVCFLSATPMQVQAQTNTPTINIYSARHYPTDEALYSDFTKSTGIKINRVDSDDAGTLTRLKSEGNASPADVILLVDAARLWRAEVDGLFLPIKSKLLDEAIPENLRAKRSDNGGTAWFGLSTRARVIVYDKQKLKKTDIDTYEKLADAQFKGKLCIRSGSHPYNLSLFGAMMDHLGPQQTEAWLKGLVANMARNPAGGDTDQIKGVASGECAVAVTNTYYLARLMRSSNESDKAMADKSRRCVS